MLHRKLDRIDEQVERAKRIIEQVRRFSRPHAPDTATFNVARAVELACGFVIEQYRAAGITLMIETGRADDASVEGNQTLFEQALVNVLVNARDAFSSPVPGRTGGEDRVRVEVRAEEKQVVIEIADNAGGIRPDVLDRIFLPFVTTKSEDAGTGLGLSIARTSIANMGGSIDARNIGDGATFRITLPRLEPDRIG